jgi:diadenosine tetraphosphate (Ap4A) HIT family hydrolase
VLFDNSHLHMHLISRYPGDMPNPRSDVRWVVADKADDWTGRNQVQPK